MMPLPTSSSGGNRRTAARRAFALVIVLIIISALALVAVGYLSSMGQERATANAFGNKARAEQSAQAGVDTAMGILKDYFKAFPDSATVWEVQSTNADGTKNEGTSLYLRAVPDASGNLPNPAPNPTDTTANSTGGNGPNNVNASGVDNRKTFVLPLLSGAAPVLQSNRTLPASTTNGYIDLNNRRSLGYTQGWIGSPPNYTNPSNPLLPKPFRVPWVEVRQQDGYTNNASTAPLVGRYAFWVEDESFRTNVSYAGSGQAPGNIRRDNTANCALNPTDVNLVGTLDTIGDADPSTVAQNLLNARNYYPGTIFPESRAYAHTAGLTTATSNGLRFLTTSQSAALNLSRHGTQRLNLNAVIPNTTAASDVATAQKQLGEIVKTIAFHAPNFGQRLYRTSCTSTSPIHPTNLNSVGPPYGPTTAHATIYLNKIAANIRDYIDPDCIPTVVYPSNNADIIGQVRTNGRPTVSLYVNDGANAIWAFGKDAAPFLQEAAVHIADGRQTGDPANKYTVNIDYYVEVWNMSTRKVSGADLGPNAFIRIINPPAWFGDLKSNPTNTTSLADGSGHSLTDTRTYGVAGGRDYDIDISGVTFPPGAVTVITTDPNYAALVPSISDTNPVNQTEAANHFVYCQILGAGKRVYTGTIPSNCDEIRLHYDYAPAFTTDYETEVIIGNDNGYIDSLAGAIPVATGSTITIPVSSSATANRPVYGGYLRGNLATGIPTGGNEPSAVGDPRANNEQINLIEHVPTNPPSSLNPVDETGYKRFDKSSSGSKVPPTFGLPNLYSIAPPKGVNPWSDYYWFPGNDGSHTISPALPGSSSTAIMSAQYAPGVIANAPLTSIGQLGDIYDPARLPAGNTYDVTYSRGGGRSLRIGQHDDLCDGVQDSPSSGWASWRLTDFFSITDNIEQPGLININGLARDNGAALQAAFKGFNFQQTTADCNTTLYDPMIHGDPTLAGLAYDTSYGLKNLINDMVQHRLATGDITKIAPFFERGEISETPLLNPANSSNSSTAPGNPPPGAFTSNSSNVAMSTTLNRARQELVRRLIEMTTTRGSVFTVYAVGQAVNQTTAGAVTTTQVQATHQLRVTFKLVPKTSAGDPFHPGTDSTGNPYLFDPTSTSEVTKRFAKPDHYDIQVLSITSGNS